jgi:hypothetical protein
MALLIQLKTISVIVVTMVLTIFIFDGSIETGEYTEVFEKLFNKSIDKKTKADWE